LGDVSLLLTVTLALGFAFWPATPTALAASALTITTPSSASSPPNATVGSSYSFALDASGGDGQYTWSIASGGLPPGLALSTSGVISGTPTVVSKNGSFVAAVRSAGEAASQAFTIWANPAPPSPFGPGYCVSFGAGHISAAAAANLPNFEGVYACGPYYTPATGTPYDEDGNTSFQCVELSARFLSAIYGITLGFGKSYQGNSVNGWNLVAYIGSKYGIPIGEPGANSNVPQPGDIMSFGPGGVTGSAGHTAVVIKSNPGSFVIMSENMSNAIQDGTSGEQLVYVNGEHPSSVEFARSLAGGYTGVWTTASWLELAGTVPTPTASANALPTPAVSPPQTARIFEITTASTSTVPPNATVGRPYSFTLAATAGFEGPYLWSLAKGTLPPGLTLRKDGVVSGTPTAVSRGRPVTVAVRDASSHKTEKDFTIWAVRAASGVLSACAFENYALPPGVPPLPAPGYPQVPKGVSLPSGTTIYGAEAGGPTYPEKLYILGPKGVGCTGAEGIDGGIGLSLTANGTSSGPDLVDTLYFTGGAEGSSWLACPFIAQAASSPASQGSDCTPPTGAIIRAVSTALSGRFIALVSETPQPGDADYQTLMLVTYQTQASAPYGGAQETSCSLSPSQRSVCAASLAWFISTQSFVGGELSDSTLKTVLSEISAFSRKPTG
jgi:hypothetical protein